MPERIGKSKRRQWLWLGAGPVAALLLAVLSAGWWLPPLVEAVLRHELAKRGCVDAEIHVVSVSPSRAELGPVVLGRGADAFRIDTVRLTYALSGLAKGRLKTVELVGLQATVRQGASVWSVVGLEPFGAQYPAVAGAAESSHGPFRLPFDALLVRASTIHVQTGAAEIRIPVEASCGVRAGGSQLVFAADLSPEGQPIKVHGDGDLDTRSAAITWNAPDLDLVACLDKLVKPFLPAAAPPELRVAGRVAASGQVSFRNGVAGPLEATARSADILLGWGETQARVAPLWFLLKAPAGIESLSAETGGSVRDVVFGGSRYGGGDAPLGGFDLTVSALARGKTIEASGALSVSPNLIVLKPLFPGMTVAFKDKGPRVRGQWNARREAGKPWQADLELSLDEEMSVTSVSPPAKLSGQAHVDLLASLDGDSLAASAVVRVEKLAGEIAGTTVAVSEVGLWAALPPGDSGFTSVVQESPGWRPFDRLRVPSPVEGLSSAAAAVEAARAPGVVAPSQASKTGLAAVLESGLEGGFVLTGGAFRHAAYGSCAELNVALPLAWSAGEGLRTPQAADGAPPIQWRGLVVQDVRLKEGAAGLGFTDTGARLEAHVASEASALAANLVAQASWAKQFAATLDVDVPPVLLTEKEPFLATRLQAFPGATCTAQIGAHVQVKMAAGAPLQASGRVVLDKGELAYPAKKLSIKGIAGAIDIASLLPLRTPPAQRLTFTAAEMAGMPVDGGTLVFQVESPESVFIEQGDLSWAGGWLRGYAFRFNPAHPEGNVVLYADAIDLSRFLSSFKNFKGQGSGILYGRLPFRVQNGVVRFADGFLISVPGQPGHLKLTEQDWLVTALDQTKMDAAMLARVKKALTDFDFTVFRMDLETGDAREALLRVRVAGKGRQDPDLPPLDLEVNVRGPLDYLFNLGLRLAK